MPAQCTVVQPLQGYSIVECLSFGRLVESKDQFGQGALIGAGTSDQSDLLSRFHDQRSVAQHRRPVQVAAKADALELDAPFEWRRGSHSSGVLLGLRLHHVGDPLELSADHRLQLLDRRDQEGQRSQKGRGHGAQRQDRSQGHTAVQHVDRARQQQKEGGDDVQRRSNRTDHVGQLLPPQRDVQLLEEGT